MPILRAPRGVNVLTHVLLLLRGPHLHQSCKCIHRMKPCSTTPRLGPGNETFGTFRSICTHEFRCSGSTLHPDGETETGTISVNATSIRLTSLLTMYPQSFHLTFQQTLPHKRIGEDTWQNVHHRLLPAQSPATEGVPFLVSVLGFANVILFRCLFIWSGTSSKRLRQRCNSSSSDVRGASCKFSSISTGSSSASLAFSRRGIAASSLTCLISERNDEMPPPFLSG